MPAETTSEEQEPKYKAIDENKVDWQTLKEKWDIDKDALAKSGDLTEKLYNRKSKLVVITPTFAGEKFPIEAHLSFRQDPDGSVKLVPHFIQSEQKLDLFMGYKFSKVNDKMKRWYDESTDQIGNLRELAALTARGDHIKDITAYILKMMNENEKAKEMLEVAKRPLEPSVISLDIKNIRLTDFMKALGYKYPMAADGDMSMYPVPYSTETDPNLVINIRTNQWRDIKSGAYGGIYDLAYELTGSCNMSELNHYIAGQMKGLKPDGLLLNKQEQPKQEPKKPHRKIRM